jgi:hypothetical protein
MIKKLFKILLIIFLGVFLIILYLSFIGVKTEKFNEKISNSLLELNKKINLDLKEVRYLLNPQNFSLSITTKDSLVLLEGNKLKLKEIKTNVSLKSLIFNEFLIDDLQISTKFIKLSDLILLARSFKNSTQLFLLNKAIKEGSLAADIRLNFDDAGKMLNDYQINGFIKNAKLNFLNRFNVNNLNLEFDIQKKKYSLINIKSDINGIKLSSPLVKINQKKDMFLITGKTLTNKKDFDKTQLKNIFAGFLKNKSIEKIRLSSENIFSFNVSKKLKVNNLNIVSKIDLNELVVKNNYLELKSYIPDLSETINFENHKIIINYNKKKLDIKGNGKILIKDKLDSIDYQLINNNDLFDFNTKINLKNSKLLIDFLDYQKINNVDASILIKGKLKKDKSIKFDLISFIEKKNKFSFNNLNLSKNFKLISIDSFNLDYLNSRNIQNQLFLKKDSSNYTIKGESFDATKLIDQIMDSDEEKSFLFNNFNSRINLNIKKTYIDKVNFINNLSGEIDFKKNKIVNLVLRSIFPNNKKINLSIETNNQQEKITRLFTDYPKPLIKRYNFIKGFEEGYLDYYSLKKNGTSSSSLIIDNFKIKEVPIFAKLLSLASLQGMADLLTGEGIRFSDFEMKFSNNKGLTTIEEMYAIGPAVSIMMDGYIESKKEISLRGTLVPATTINRTIASIPLIGNILVGKKSGEGVFGVSFKIKGEPKSLKTTVNPIKTLTPRFITRTLEKIKKN